MSVFPSGSGPGGSPKVGFPVPGLRAPSTLTAVCFQKATPAPLQTKFPQLAIPGQTGAPQLSPGARSSPDKSPSRIESSPTRSNVPGLTTHSAQWLSMKMPDMLSASERVMHHNLANLAVRIDQLQQGFTRFASSRQAGKQYSALAFALPLRS